MPAVSSPQNGPHIAGQGGCADQADADLANAAWADGWNACLDRVKQSSSADLIDDLHGVMRQLGDMARDASTAPAVPDVLWEIRRIAYDNV